MGRGVAGLLDRGGEGFYLLEPALVVKLVDTLS
jgi:hypothetical protein